MGSNRLIALLAGSVVWSLPKPTTAAEPVQPAPSLRETGRLADAAANHPPIRIPAAHTERDALREQPIPKLPDKTSVAPASQAQPAFPGKIDPSVLAKLLRSRFALLQECPTEVARHKRVSLGSASAGRLLLRWTIAADGRVADTAVVAMSQVNPYVMDCVKRQMSVWLFSPPEGGAVRVERRFSFHAR